jgi:hypothetical protein
MSTEAQIDANRRNAQKSTGPSTPEGKTQSSANALKHGLAAGFRVLQAENQDEFDELIAKYRREFAPTNSYEESLVEELAQSRWRLARARRLEAQMVDAMLEATVFNDSDGALVFALLNNHAGPFVVIQRYIAAAERTGHRARNQFLAIRRQEAQAARETAQPNEPNSPPTPTNSKGNGIHPCSSAINRSTVSAPAVPRKSNVEDARRQPCSREP